MPYALLAILSIPLFFLNIHDVHSAGDDFAQYIKEAQNIAHGRPYYQSGYVFNACNTDYAPPQYPPGFPLLLAPVVKVWGIAIRPMLYFMSAISAALLFALYAYFRKYTGAVNALCLAVAITYSNYMVDMKENILSDVPCLLFVVLYLTLRRARSFSWQRIVLLVLISEMAVLIRSQAMILFVAEAVYLCFYFIRNTVKERTASAGFLYTVPSAFIITGGILLNFVLSRFVFYTSESTGAFYGAFVHKMLRSGLFAEAGMNIHRLLPNIASFLYFESNNNGFLRMEIAVVKGTGIVFSIAGFLLCIARRFVIDDVLFVLMCLMLVFFPVYDLRYFLPALPMLFFYCFTAFRVILHAFIRRNLKLAGVALTLCYLGLGYDHLKRDARKDAPADFVPYANDIAAFQYIRSHVDSPDIIVCLKPRLLTLYTDRRSMNIAPQVSPEINRKMLDSLQVKYLLMAVKTGNGLAADYIRDVLHPTDTLRPAEGYILYRLR